LDFIYAFTMFGVHQLSNNDAERKKLGMKLHHSFIRSRFISYQRAVSVSVDQLQLSIVTFCYDIFLYSAFIFFRGGSKSSQYLGSSEYVLSHVLSFGSAIFAAGFNGVEAALLLSGAHPSLRNLAAPSRRA
jgi:hypothetical protein